MSLNTWCKVEYIRMACTIYQRKCKRSSVFITSFFRLLVLNFSFSASKNFSAHDGGAFCVQGPQGRHGIPGKNGIPGHDGKDGTTGRDGE